MAHKGIRPVILSGGSGTRLWPASTEMLPKQFAELPGGRRLLKETLQRVRSLGDPIIVTIEAHRFFVQEVLGEMGLTGTILIEPMPRGTAAAFAAAACFACELGIDEPLLILPADHEIGDGEAFCVDVEMAAQRNTDGLTCFGVTATRPETGYGWIRPTPGQGLRSVAAFLEKPDAVRARELLVEGGHFWNSGIVLAKAEVLVDVLGQYAPQILAGARDAVLRRSVDLGFIRLAGDSYDPIPPMAFDVAVLEKSTMTKVMPVDWRWSDLGSWDAIAEASPADSAGNHEAGRAVTMKCCRTFVSSSGPLVAAVGLDDVVVAATPDAILVTKRSASQDVGGLVKSLAAAGYPEATGGRTELRPWGSFTVLHGAKGFKVKSIVVKPGGRLSLQSHDRRSEHWVIVRGSATVELDGAEKVLEAGQSIDIPVGARHRLQNKTESQVEIVEVQLGDYLGEDDIIRYEDSYGR